MAPTFVGLTGGISAGKSEALAAFERAGAATLASDDVVHDLLRDEGLRERLVERWGEGIAPNGEVDRARVAEIVFERPEELAWLEAEVHPLVADRFAAWRAGLPAGVELAVVEVPLLFETGMESVFDAVVAVVADDRLREDRARGRELAALEGRGARQLSQEEKADRATHVIANDGTLAELEARIEELVRELTGSGDR
ncbi:MAG TPA: dephospho-CoA kinase [Solirubrobacterales bacterium]|nr:dephospho-CoA kinase [Solirubrobacterales bacterium]